MSKYLNIDKMKVYDDVSQKFISVSELKGIEDADVIEVVRCKDCKNYVKGTCYLLQGLTFPAPDEYCSYAERRETNAD